MNKDPALKQSIESVSALAAKVINMTGANIDEPEKMVKYDMASFAMLITAADGVIAPEEAEVICYYFDLDVSPKNIGMLLESLDILSEEFISTPPSAIVAAVLADNAIHAAGEDEGSCITEAVFETYRAIAAEVADAEGGISKEESGAANLYLNMMYRYIKENIENGYVPKE